MRTPYLYYSDRLLAGRSAVATHVQPAGRIRSSRRQRREMLPLVAAIGLSLLVGATVAFVGPREPAASSSFVPIPRPGAPLLTFGTLWERRHPAPDLGVGARSAILVDLDARQVMFERDADGWRAPASLTKLMTAMVAVDNADLDRAVTVARDAAPMEPSVLGLSAGEVVTVRILLYGLLLDSGNDAAEALARGLMPRSRFIQELNRKAKRLGLKDSQFTNPSGLDDGGLHSSAYDLAIIAGVVERDYPQVAQIAGTRDITIPATSTHKAFTPHNVNRLLWAYPGVTGLKPGYTEEAGNCVVATATRDGRRLVAVVLHAQGSSYSDASRLLDYGFSVRPAVAVPSGWML